MLDLPPEIVLNYLHSPMADARLEWLLDKQPNLVRDLFKNDREKLKENLVAAVANAVNLLPSPGESHGPERAYEAVAPSDVERPRGQRPLSERFKNQVREWFQSLFAPQTETTESEPMTS